MKELIIAIDGPSGAGKSTLSKRLAETIGYVQIDTGAMYRCVALMAARQGVDPADDAGLNALCQQLHIDFKQQGENVHVIANEEDVTSAIRTPEISLMASAVSANPEVRTAMVDLQRTLGAKGGVVLEGRDIGSVVFPDADVKFYLTASDEERGRRRYEELKARGVEVDLQQTVAEVIARDHADSSRKHAPLIQPPGAIVLDSDGLSVAEVLTLMVEAVSAERSARGLIEAPS